MALGGVERSETVEETYAWSDRQRRKRISRNDPPPAFGADPEILLHDRPEKVQGEHVEQQMPPAAVNHPGKPQDADQAGDADDGKCDSNIHTLPGVVFENLQFLKIAFFCNQGNQAGVRKRRHFTVFVEAVLIGAKSEDPRHLCCGNPIFHPDCLDLLRGWNAVPFAILAMNLFHGLRIRRRCGEALPAVFTQIVECRVIVTLTTVVHNPRLLTDSHFLAGKRTLHRHIHF